MSPVASLREASPTAALVPRPSEGGCYGSSEVEIVEPGAPCEVVPKDLACGSCRTCGKPPAHISRVSHRSLDGANGCAAHRLHEARLLDSL